tara:strand:+ start:3701 stop:4867 length:1167 start_codon:yes stop_codon:yes gene_type:complete
MSLSIRLALNYLFKQKLNSFSNYASWLAIGGLSIGVSCLMLTASIIEGFEKTLSYKLSNLEGKARIKNIFGKNIDVSNPVLDSLLFHSSDNLDQFIKDICLIRFGENAEGVIIEGRSKLPLTNYKSTFSELREDEIVIGSNLAENMNIQIGDRLFLQTFSKGENIFNIPKIKPVMVRNIFSTGLKEYDNTLVFMRLDDARKFFNYMPSEISGLIVNYKFFENKEINVNYPYFIETWKDRHALLYDWISIQRWPAYIMFGLISLVGLVNLTAAISMIIIEKKYQIGILYSQGITKYKLQKIFIYQGAIIGLIGSFIGGILSIVIIFLQKKYKLLEIPTDIYFMDQIPFSFNYSVFIIILLSVSVFSILISWLPTKSIPHNRPSKLLRYE